LRKYYEEKRGAYAPLSIFFNYFLLEQQAFPADAHDFICASLHPAFSAPTLAAPAQLFSPSTLAAPAHSFSAIAAFAAQQGFTSSLTTVVVSFFFLSLSLAVTFETEIQYAQMINNTNTNFFMFFLLIDFYVSQILRQYMIFQ
jgi:hypothetical protein